MSPTQPSDQQHCKNNREQDPNDHILERAAQRERRHERTAPVAVRNRMRQVRAIARRTQAQRVAAVASDEYALRELNWRPRFLTIPELTARLQRRSTNCLARSTPPSPLLLSRNAPPTLRSGGAASPVASAFSCRVALARSASSGGVQFPIQLSALRGDLWLDLSASLRVSEAQEGEYGLIEREPFDCRRSLPCFGGREAKPIGRDATPRLASITRQGLAKTLRHQPGRPIRSKIERELQLLR